MKLAIGIATTGRREGLSQTISYLRRQTRAADALYICPATEADLDPRCLNGFPSDTVVVTGPKGLPAQRNTILRHLKDEDVVAFFDDDYLPEPVFLEELEALFARNPDLGIATGHVVADGAHNEGISFESGVTIIEDLPPPADERLQDTYGGYGCNMAIRVSLIRANNVLFDENLPLYGWWEDIDFSRRLAAFGTIKQSFRLRGVHLGSKSGRSPGKRLGYSQVANILYMVRKGSVSPGVATKQIARNVSANLAKLLFPEPWVDRRGRLIGNLMAFADAARGVVDPQKILKL